MRAVIYARVSTEDQAKHGYSVAAQLDACRQKARELGATEVEEYIDDGISGDIINRPGLVDAVKSIQGTKTDFFICLDPDRLARKLALQLIVTDDIDKTNCHLVFINHEFQNTPEGRLFYALRGAIAEYEKEKIKERSRRGKLQKARQGKLTHDPQMFAYKYNKTTSLPEIVPDKAEILKMMFRWVLEERESYHGIANRLNAMGIPSPRNRTWTKTTVKRILQNPAYTGIIYLNRMNKEGIKNNKYRDPKDKISPTLRPEEEWIPVHIPAIIDQRTFLQTQEILAANKRRYPGETLGNYLLSGLITCGNCGSTCTGTRAKSKTGQYFLRYYRCSGKIRKKNGCEAKHIKADRIEEAVWKRIKQIVLNPELLIEEQNRKADNSSQLAAEVAELEKALKGLTEEKERLIYLFQKNLIGEDDIEKRLAALQENESVIKTRQKQLGNIIAHNTITMDNIKNITTLSTSIKDGLDNMDYEGKKNLINLLVSQIIANGEDWDVYINASGLEFGYDPAHC